MKEPGFRIAVSMSDIAAGPADRVWQAGERDRTALAAWLGVDSIERLEAAFTVSPWRRSGIKAAGTIRAELTQTCVVTLAPLTVRLDVPFLRRFAPRGEWEKLVPSGPEAEVLIDAEDPPEPFDGRAVDLGPAVREELGLAVDPFPRAEGAVFDAPGEAAGGADGAADSAPQSPFAALKPVSPKPS